MGKLQAPNTKPQGNLKHQVPRHPRRVGFCLEFGIWSFLGVWCLEFGVFIGVLGLMSLNVCAQPTTPPLQDPLISLMASQPRLDIASVVTATAAFDPPVVGPDELSVYRVTFNALEQSIEWPEPGEKRSEVRGQRSEQTSDLRPPTSALPSPLSSLPSPVRIRAGARGQILQTVGPFLEARTTFNYRVRSAGLGVYIVPEFIVNVYGKPVTVPAARLEVVSSPPLPRFPSPSDGEGARGRGAQQLVLEVPVTNLFAGQTAKVRVQLPGSQPGVVQGLAQMQLIGQGFVLDPSSARLNRGGSNLGAFVYDATFMPIATGKLSVFAQAYMLGNNFGGPVVLPAPAIVPGGPQYTLLDSEPVELEVRPLPREGQLPGFTGAIGSFALEPPRLATNILRVGEPVSLYVRVRGEGNLARLVPPPAPQAPFWQVFAGAADGASAQPSPPGFTTFVYTVIPLAEAARATPPIPFSCFDPNSGRYVDLTIPPVPVTVKPGTASADLQALLEPGSSDNDREKELNLKDLALSPGRAAGSLVPLQQHPWFPLVELSPAAAFIGLWGWDRRRRYLEEHPRILLRRRARRAFRRECRVLRQAARRGNAERFAAAAVNAMRLACATHYPAEPRALVGSDVLETLDPTAVSQRADRACRAVAWSEGGDSVIVRRFFDVADASRFDTAPADATELLALQPELDRVLQQLEARL